MIVGNPIMYESVSYLLREDVFAQVLGDKNSFVVALLCGGDPGKVSS
jgi:hypothetical protein